MCSKTKNSKTCVKCAVIVNSVDMNLLVDIASDVSLVSLQLFDNSFVREALEPRPVSITWYTSQKIPTVGCFHAKVKYKYNYASDKFHVVEKSSNLMGKYLIQFVCINIKGNTLPWFATTTCTSTAGKVSDLRFDR